MRKLYIYIEYQSYKKQQWNSAYFTVLLKLRIPLESLPEF